MWQMRFSSSGADVYRKQTRRVRFLTEMDGVVPWQRLCALIEPQYPRGDRDHPPTGIERMLWIHFLPQWFNLSDSQAEDALYDIASMRSFADIDLGREAAPDETIICTFRHLIEVHDLDEEMLRSVNEHLQAKGVKIGIGTLVDATIIAASSSTKNAGGRRDPEMHQMTTRRGQLTKAETITVAVIEDNVPALVEARTLVDSFHEMIRTKTAKDPTAWLISVPAAP